MTAMIPHAKIFDVDKANRKDDDRGQHMSIAGTFLNGNKIGGMGLELLRSKTDAEIEDLLLEDKDLIPNRIKSSTVFKKAKAKEPKKEHPCLYDVT